MTSPLDEEVAALWSALPLQQRTAASTLRTLADATGIEPGLLQRQWRDALLVEVTHLAQDEIRRQFDAAELERMTPTEAITESVRILASIAARYPQVLEHDSPANSRSFEHDPEPPLRSTFARARAEGVIRDDVPLEQLAASLRGLLAGTLRAAERTGADLNAAAAAVARLFLEAANPGLSA
jgi:TetR/AcrR family transcriptional regulator, mexCD-oprJ operon repressor